MKICVLNRVCIQAAILLVLSMQVAGATDLVYTPINPSFGGNPSNGPMLLNNAQAQNSNKAPTLTRLQRFNQNLESSILNHVASQAINTMFGGNNALTPGTYDTSLYTVVVVQNGDGSLQIQTTDKSNGATTTFDVSTGM